MNYLLAGALEFKRWALLEMSTTFRAQIFCTQQKQIGLLYEPIIHNLVYWLKEAPTIDHTWMPALLYLYVEWFSLNAKLLSWNSTQGLKSMDTSWENDNIKEKASKKKNL